jgi:hypothetical protein
MAAFRRLSAAANYYEQLGSIDAAFELTPSEFRARLLLPANY